jgi:threonine aldolase
VYFDLERMTSADFEERCRRRGLLADSAGTHRVRLVTHYGITSGDIQAALKICQEALSG